MQAVGRAVVVKVVKVCEQGREGMIYGIPLTIEMKELVKHLKEKCESVQSAKRLTKGIEEKKKLSQFWYSSTQNIFLQNFTLDL